MVILRATTEVNLRTKPGLQASVDGYLCRGILAYVVGGFASADGLTWINIVAPCADGVWRDGWAAGGIDNNVLLSGYTLPVTLEYPLDRPWATSQMFGENPDIYCRFNMLGHNGIDFGCTVGAPVVAVDGGRASHVRSDPSGYGNYIRIDHAWGVSLYAHLNAQSIVEGQSVSRGQLIGLSGNSGGSTGPHLHFEVRVQPIDETNGFGGRVDPLPFLPADKVLIPNYVPHSLVEAMRDA